MIINDLIQKSTVIGLGGSELALINYVEGSPGSSLIRYGKKRWKIFKCFEKKKKCITVGGWNSLLVNINNTL